MRAISTSGTARLQTALVTGVRLPIKVLTDPRDQRVAQVVVRRVGAPRFEIAGRARRTAESPHRARTRSHTSCHCAPRCRTETPSSRRTRGQSRRSRPSGRSRTPTGDLATTLELLLLVPLRSCWARGRENSTASHPADATTSSVRSRGEAVSVRGAQAIDRSRRRHYAIGIVSARFWASCLVSCCLICGPLSATVIVWQLTMAGGCPATRENSRSTDPPSSRGSQGFSISIGRSSRRGRCQPRGAQQGCRQ